MKHLLLITTFLGLLLLGINGCGNKEQKDFSEYISGYTSGMVTAESPIYIYLAKPADKSFQAGSVLPAKLVNFTPAVKGECMLKDEHTVMFTPETPLKNGETYQVAFQLGNICTVEKGFENFTFKFNVIPLSILFEPGKLTIEPDNTNALQYQGSLICSDYMEAKEVEKLVSGTFKGTSLVPVWEHAGNRHYFRFRNLEKSDKEEVLQLNFKKEVSNEKTVRIPIPGKNIFNVLNIEISESSPAVISIYMSENIDPEQDLKGLVNIPGITLDNFKIDQNVIRAYLPSSSSMKTGELNLYPGIRSITGNTLQNTYTTSLQLQSLKPEVEFIGKGVIVPDKNQVLVPFSAVGLKAVDLEIIQVSPQNMNFFLQENTYDGYGDLVRTARPVFMKKIDLLEKNPNIDTDKWNNFTIDLAKLVKLEKGNIYRIVLKFKKSYTTLDCADELPDSDYGTTDWDNSNGYAYYNEYSYPSGYKWSERDDPTSVSYYTGERFAKRNIINTSLGLMAKQGMNNQYHICVSDLATAQPVSNCKITLYNYQNQEIGTASTDKEGFATLETDTKAFIVLAQKGNDRAWLKLADGNALSLSNFDVSGQHVQMGVKGFIYGERGVWRPGDDLHLSLILEDKMNTLPEGHPIVAQLLDPNGRIVQSLTDHIGKNNIYSFTFHTDEQAQTGYWNAIFRIGGLTFRKTVRIETVKPNRLAIQLHFPNEHIIGKGIAQNNIEVETRWLNGAQTSNQKATAEVKLYAANQGFKDFQDYTFSDKSKYFEPSLLALFDGTTDAQGKFTISLDKIKTENAPGLLNALFTTRVFESGADFSISTQSITYSPYKEYVGIRLPASQDEWYSTQAPVRLSGVTVNAKGEQQGNTEVRIEVYKLDWRWWWDSRDEYLGSYINREYSKSVFARTVNATDGSFHADLNIKESGRYFIRAILPSGHTSGIIAYFGNWADEANQETATMLQLSTDKKEYKVGEIIRVTLPSDKGSTLIATLENGKMVSDIRRIPAENGTTTLEFKATSDMCPNTYIAVSLIQPHNNRGNDRPIRLYGVININVSDPALRLSPEIQMPKELRPGEDFTVQIKEKNKQEMNYTIAIVDEGLLSLTSFRTPDPFGSFYAREALGVKTWDFYDYIYGAYGARLDKAFAVGGDESLKAIQDEKTNRFKPVVLFAGPFSLQKGETGSHTFKMPEYIGEVRTMVIAATNGKYGSASYNSRVSKPLMLSAALPRLLTPGDIIDLPVSVFAMQENIRQVSVKIKTDDKITIEGKNSQEIHFSKTGEQVVFFKARINETTGTATIRIEATAGKETTKTTEDLTVRIPNPRITTMEEKELKAGESITFDEAITGVEPASVLEISSIPPLNIEQRLTYLLEYPHGCAEQITSKAFPQLSLPYLMNLSAEERLAADNNIREVINQLANYQTPEGGFAIWQRGKQASNWVTSYVTHFLTSAQRQGYAVPTRMLQNALNFLKKAANTWQADDSFSNQLSQAYRLYVLAFAGQADFAAMNRLREIQLQRTTSQWLLASAYALCNQKEIANKMIASLSSEVLPYRETGGNYGSSLRDQALILQSMVTLDKRQEAYRMLENISKSMGSQEWCNTQETAFALHAAAAYVQTYLGSQQGIQVTVTTDKGKQEIRGEKTVWQLPLDVHNGQANVSVQNNGQGNLSARRITVASSLKPITDRINSGLKMAVRYLNSKGMPQDIRHLKQGEDIFLEITVKNIGVTGNYEDLALNCLVPSGFEIINERLTGDATLPGADYTDIRDDRFYVYFSLAQGQEKTFRFRCNAAFRGNFLLPAIQCSSMYDNSIQAVVPGGEITIKP